MGLEGNSLKCRSEDYQTQVAQYQQFLGHQQAQLELHLHQLDLQQQCQVCQTEGNASWILLDVIIWNKMTISSKLLLLQYILRPFIYNCC